MNVPKDTDRPLGLALAAALFCGLLLAWPRGYWGIAAPVCAMAAVGAAWAIFGSRPVLDWRYVPVGLMGVWAVGQRLVGASVAPALTGRAAITWGVSAIAFVVAAETLRRRRVRDWFLKVLLGGSVALAGWGIIQKFVFPGQVFGLFPSDASVFGTFFYVNQFAGFVEMAAPIALWRVLRGDAVYGSTCYAILAGAAIASGSRAGVVLVLAELAIFLIVAAWSRQFARGGPILVVGMVLVLTAAAALVVGTDYVWHRLEDRVPETVRLDLSKSTLEMVRQRPWLGYGMGAWRPVYPQFATFDLALIANEAHDDWLQWAAEGGVPFALLMAVVAVSLARPAVRSVWGLGIPIVLVHSFVDYVLREPALAFLWFAMGGMLCANLQGEREL
jgi:hypothetical protein